MPNPDDTACTQCGGRCEFARARQRVAAYTRGYFKGRQDAAAETYPQLVEAEQNRG